MTVKITAQNFETTVLQSDKTVLLDFWATWCGPCQMIAPLLEEIAAERPDILVGKVNVDDEPLLAQQFGIVSIPTLLVIKDGTVTGKLVGARPKQQILQML